LFIICIELILELRLEKFISTPLKTFSEFLPSSQVKATLMALSHCRDSSSYEGDMKK